jgi:hypothetical protein
MIPQLLPPDDRARNRRRWSFRFSGLTTITLVCVGVWNATPADWHPALPECGKYAVMGVAIGLALAANASHLFDQPSLDEPKSPAGNDYHQGDTP